MVSLAHYKITDILVKMHKRCQFHKKVACFNLNNVALLSMHTKAHKKNAIINLEID